jgi:hypothetical protein
MTNENAVLKKYTTKELIELHSFWGFFRRRSGFFREGDQQFCDSDQGSERSDAGEVIVAEVIGIVKLTA